MTSPGKFKSVIFFGPSDKRTLSYKEGLGKISLIKVFQVVNLDELQQILDMCEKSVVLTDSDAALEFLAKFNLEKKISHRKYHLDWDNKISIKDASALSVNKISVIKASEPGSIDEKIELYLFGRVKVFDLGVFVPASNQVSEMRSKNYFTFLAYADSKWKIIISSHEKEDNISYIIGKNWDGLVYELTLHSDNLAKTKESLIEEKNYYEIVYPYFAGDKLCKMCIVHFYVDSNFEENKKKVLSFLSKIPG